MVGAQSERVSVKSSTILPAFATQRDFTETIKTLAGLSRFIIADITDPKCIPLEMQAIVPDFMVPLVPIIQEPQIPFAMIQDLQQKCEWVFDVIAYDSKERLIGALEREIVQPQRKWQINFYP